MSDLETVFRFRAFAWTHAPTIDGVGNLLVEVSAVWVLAFCFGTHAPTRAGVGNLLSEVSAMWVLMQALVMDKTTGGVGPLISH